MQGNYDPNFYAAIEDGSVRSAEAVLPVVFDLVKPKHVLDVGCGTGGWLSIASKLGAARVAGFDGPWVDISALRIPAASFQHVEFEAERAPDFGQGFDLAICMEVLEHLTDQAGRRVVAALAAAAPACLVSAAIPGQGGNGHINERWQSYWSEAFAAHGFATWDVVRPKIWAASAVEPWYRQNALLYVHPRAGLAQPADIRSMPLDVAHPAIFAERAGEATKFRARYDKTLKRKVGNAIRAVRNRVRSA